MEAGMLERESARVAKAVRAESQHEAGGRGFTLGLPRRAPEGLLDRVESSAWYWGYDEAASKVEGTLQFDAAQRLRLFPLGSRVRVIGYEKRLADAPRLNGRTGRVDRGHFAGVYVRLDPRPREKSVKVELITWGVGDAPTLQLIRD